MWWCTRIAIASVNPTLLQIELARFHRKKVFPSEKIHGGIGDIVLPSQVNESHLLKKLIRCALYYLTRDSAITLRVRSQGSPPFPQGYKHSQQKWILAKKLRPAWFRRCTFHELNLIEYVRLWSDTGATSDSDGAPCLEPKLSSTKVRQTLSNLTLLPHQTKTAAPNWFRHRSFAVLNSSVRFCTLVKMRLNQA